MSENAVIKSLHTDFARKITRKFTKAIEDYRLLQSGDSVLVCVSGSGVSMLLAALLRDFEQHGNVPISGHYLSFDPEVAKAAAELLDLPIKTERKLCGGCPEKGELPKRLFENASEHGCNKIASETHFDDVIEEILAGVIFGGESRTLLPRQRAEDSEAELIRPLYLVRERDITAWKNAHDLRFREPNLSPERQLAKRLIERLCEGNPQVPQNIFRSVCNVRLDHIISYSDGIVHSFLDDYDD